MPARKLSTTSLIVVAMVAVGSMGGRAVADTLSIGCPALLPKDHNVQYDCNGARLVSGSGNLLTFTAPVFLPTGASMTGVTLEAADSSGGPSGGYVRLQLVRARFNTIQILATVQTDVAGAPGNVRLAQALGTPVVVDNSDYSYHVTVTMLNGSGGAFTTWFFKAFVRYDPPGPKPDVIVLPLY